MSIRQPFPPHGWRRFRATLLGRLLTRLAWGAFTLLCTALIIFLLLHLSGDPAQMIAGEKADQETVERIRRELGLDRPVPIQFARYIGRVCQGDLGSSTFYEQPVIDLLLARLPYTTWLALGGLVVWVGVGVPIGVWTSQHRGRWPDKLMLIVAVVTYSIPTFWLGRMMQYQFAYDWRLFPVGSIGSFWHLCLPSLTLGLAGVGYYMRLIHTNMLEVLPTEYIRTARAKGLPERVVIWKHAFRNAMLPLVTVLGLDTARLFGGVVFTEAVFSWPGLGSQVVAAIFTLDIPLVMGTVLFSAALVIVANIIVDLLYQWLDPRIGEGAAG